MFYISTINERIQEVIHSQNIKKIKFAEDIGISSPAVTLLCSGKTKPSERTVKLICSVYGVRYDWLVNGEGEMYNDDGDAQVIIDNLMTGDNDFAKKVIKELAKQDDAFWDKAYDFARSLFSDDK